MMIINMTSKSKYLLLGSSSTERYIYDRCRRNARFEYHFPWWVKEKKINKKLASHCEALALNKIKTSNTLNSRQVINSCMIFSVGWLEEKLLPNPSIYNTHTQKMGNKEVCRLIKMTNIFNKVFRFLINVAAEKRGKKRQFVDKRS